MEVINVMAASIDGRIGSQALEGDLARQKSGLSSTADQRHLRETIEKADAIIVGASSIRANGECLDHPGRLGRPPSWYIYCQNSIPKDFEFWNQRHIPRILVSSQNLEVPVGPNLSSLNYGQEDPARYLFGHLSEQNHQTVLLFGGGVINSWFYEQKLVDRLLLTISPLFIGQQDAPFLLQPQLKEPVHFSLQQMYYEGDYVFLDYQVRP